MIMVMIISVPKNLVSKSVQKHLYPYLPNPTQHMLYNMLVIVVIVVPCSLGTMRVIGTESPF